LATVYGVVTQSGGYIGVESALGAGTTYRVCLPRVQATSKVMPSLTLSGAAEPTGATVLIAEDEAVVRTMIREVLRSAGYNVLEASNGRDAIRIHGLHGDSIDVLLTDVVMPDLSGVELATQLTAASSGLRTLFISGYAGAATVALSDAPFLQKPFTPRELTAKLHDVLAQPVGAAA
jgi:two-component system, cell cycle sensor histidine kinase and response regulator CckA